MSNHSGPTIPEHVRRKRKQYKVTISLGRSLLRKLDRMLINDEDTRPAVVRRLIKGWKP